MVHHIALCLEVLEDCDRGTLQGRCDMSLLLNAITLPLYRCLLHCVYRFYSYLYSFSSLYKQLGTYFLKICIENWKNVNLTFNLLKMQMFYLEAFILISHPTFCKQNQATFLKNLYKELKICIFEFILLKIQIFHLSVNIDIYCIVFIGFYTYFSRIKLELPFLPSSRRKVIPI